VLVVVVEHTDVVVECFDNDCFVISLGAKDSLEAKEGFGFGKVTSSE
jgi:hypothetical protein